MWPTSPDAGTLEAVELATQRRLWSVRVYEVRYERHQETDVQDVCVRALQTRWPCIVVVDERERRTCVDARSGAISAAPQEEARVNEKELRRNAERAALGRRESRRPGPRHPLRSERGRW
ncbi:MAG: hypothetical protein ACXWLP_03235 [Myxococcaceae bacterium]